MDSRYHVLFMNQKMEQIYPEIIINENISKNDAFKLIVAGEVQKLSRDEQWFEIRIEPLAESGYIQGYTMWALDMTQYYKKYDEILGKSTTDALTGLSNREYFQIMVTKRLYDNTPGAIFMMDMDNFKGVNDTYGHQMGDNVLISFAEVLRESLTREDLLCRIGGDEFIVFIHGVTEVELLAEIATSIINGFQAKLAQKGYPVTTTVSIGIAVTEDYNNTFERMYRHADKVLYLSKNKGKNTYYFYMKKVTPP